MYLYVVRRTLFVVWNTEYPALPCPAMPYSYPYPMMQLMKWVRALRLFVPHFSRSSVSVTMARDLSVQS
jgi:hypothetical protein